MMTPDTEDKERKKERKNERKKKGDIPMWQVTTAV